MTAHVRNMELSFEDVKAALQQFSLKEQLLLFKQITAPKNGSEAFVFETKNLKTSISFNELEGGEPHPYVIDLREDLSVEEQLEAIFQNQEPIDWAKIDALPANFGWTEADEKAFFQLD